MKICLMSIVVLAACLGFTGCKKGSDGSAENKAGEQGGAAEDPFAKSPQCQAFFKCCEEMSVALSKVQDASPDLLQGAKVFCDNARLTMSAGVGGDEVCRSTFGMMKTSILQAYTGLPGYVTPPSCAK